MTTNAMTLLGCGDVGPIHEPIATYSTLARSVLAGGDIRFAQCERVYSKRGSQQVHGSSHSRLDPHMAEVFSDCGFNVVSVASNHAMDWGNDAFLDTIDLLRDKGIQTIGGGRNLEEARKPAIVEKNGVRVAMLAYCSILKDGFHAEKKKPGVAPMRIHSYFEPIEYQAGIPPRVVTVPYAEDLQAMADDIAAAKKVAHSVVVSLHWGVHHIYKLIAEYQPIVAKAAFAAGADLILGHHAHLPKAIGVHDGKVCFYSLSNFIMSAEEKTPKQAAAHVRRYGSASVLDPDYPRLPYGTDAKRSLVAKAIITTEGVRKVSFLPALIDKQLRPEILRRGDPRFDDAVNYMDTISDDFSHKFVVEDNEVVVS